MAVRNGSRYLAESLDSLCHQLQPLDEVVIVDDASTDRTPQILEDYRSRLPRANVIRNCKPAGVAKSLNRGLALCSGKYIARFDSDDLSSHKRIQRQAEYLSENAAVGVVASWYEKIAGDGARREVVRAPLRHWDLYLRLLIENPICHPSVMMRRDILVSAGGYDEAFWTAQDTELWGRLFPKVKFYCLPEVLVQYRVHDSQVSKCRGEAGQRLSVEAQRRAISEFVGAPLTYSQVLGFRRVTSSSLGSRHDVAGFWLVVDRLREAALGRVDRERALQFSEELMRRAFRAVRRCPGNVCAKAELLYGIVRRRPDLFAKKASRLAVRVPPEAVAQAGMQEKAFDVSTYRPASGR